jgi:hypothetical protein
MFVQRKFNNDPKKLWARIRLKDYPDTPRKIDFERLAVSGESEIIIAVSIGWANDWSAYSGWPLPCKASGNSEYYMDLFSGLFSGPEGVFSNGDKLSEEDAKLLFPVSDFPELADLRYRP